jgi:hypothetical protein
MSRIKMAWNKTKTASVMLSKIKEFTIAPAGEQFRLLAWYNQENSFNLGYFKDEKEAQDFLENIHKNM